MSDTASIVFEDGSTMGWTFYNLPGLGEVIEIGGYTGVRRFRVVERLWVLGNRVHIRVEKA